MTKCTQCQCPAVSYVILIYAILCFQTIVLNRCDLQSAEVNVATRSFNNFFSFPNYKRQDTKLKSVYTLLNKYSGKHGFTNRNYLNSGRFVRLQPDKNITKNHINVSTVYNLPTGTMTDTRRAFNHSELRNINVSKGESPHFWKIIKKNMNQVLRKVPFGRMWDRYMRQTPCEFSRPSSIELSEPTTISMVPTTVEHIVAPTIYMAIKTSTKETVLTRKKVSTKRLRKIIGVKSAIPLGVRFGNKIYVVTREVTKKENNNMLPILLKYCTKHNLIQCPYGEIRMKTNYETTSLAPLESDSSRWSTSIATVDESTTTIIDTTESTSVVATYMYLLPSERSTNEILNEISTKHKSEIFFPVTNMKPTSPVVDSVTMSYVDEASILNTSEQQGIMPIFKTMNAINGWPIFNSYYELRTNKHEIKLQEDLIKVQENRANAQEVEKVSTNFKTDLGLREYS